MNAICLLALLAPTFAAGTPPQVLEKIVLNPGMQAPWPAWKQAETGVLELSMENWSAGREVMRMENSVRVKKLPSAKAGVLRQELRFGSYRMKAQPMREDMGPVEIDLTPQLKGLRLVVNAKGDHILSIEGLEKARAQALKGAERQAQQVLESLLNEEQLRNQMARRTESGCFQEAPGKKVGAKWKSSQSSGNGVQLEVECLFAGWGKVQGRPFLVIRGTVKPMEAAAKGVKAPVKTSGKIDYYADPKGEEFLVVSRLGMEMEKNSMDLRVTAHFHPW